MTETDKIKNLRSALSKCLESMHDYFGLSDQQMQEALDAAEINSEWSPYGLDYSKHRSAHWR